MTRRQHTTLILQVRIPVPAGKTQAQAVEWVKQQLCVTPPGEPPYAFTSPRTTVKLVGKQTEYL